MTRATWQAAIAVAGLLAGCMKTQTLPSRAQPGMP
jgi:hypothetical protein